MPVCSFTLVSRRAQEVTYCVLLVTHFRPKLTSEQGEYKRERHLLYHCARNFNSFRINASDSRVERSFCASSKLYVVGCWIMSVEYTMNPKIVLVRDQSQFSSSARLRTCPSQLPLQYLFLRNTPTLYGQFSTDLKFGFSWLSPPQPYELNTCTPYIAQYD